jgi:trk system potassium uptake protein
MQYAVVQRILGILLSLFSLTLLPPIMIAWWSHDNSVQGFLSAFILIIIIGLCLWFPVRNIKNELKLRDGFVVVVLFWLGLGLTGAIPFILSETPHLTFTDAIFESMSGLTTTGATIMTDIDDLPKSLGGMGIIVLAVAILPILGIGGMQLYRAETPGPMKDSKLTPRITETAKALWYIYLGLTVVCCLLYWAAGMTFFDAIGHSFSTVSIGGFSTHDQSIGYYNSVWIETIAIVFMLLSGINFTLHFFAWRNQSIRPYWQDTELKGYLGILGSICLISCAYMLLNADYTDASTMIMEALFQSISIATTTGFTTTQYQNWPSFLPMLLLFASFLGACAGSTGGGIKVVRVLLLFKQGIREIKRLIHPNALFVIKLNNKPVQERVINAIWGFFAAYILVFIFLQLILMSTGLDSITAFSAMASCMNNMGPGLGDVSENYGSINDVAKWVLCIAMLMGRLEIFTLLVLFSPIFWHK